MGEGEGGRGVGSVKPIKHSVYALNSKEDYSRIYTPSLFLSPDLLVAILRQISSVPSSPRKISEYLSDFFPPPFPFPLLSSPPLLTLEHFCYLFSSSALIFLLSFPFPVLLFITLSLLLFEA